jgi:phosphoglycolate phosphatase-like HAD superfamily hydrolase
VKKAAIFDMDGTLLESSPADREWLKKAVERVMEDRGIEKNISDEKKLALAGIEGYQEYMTAWRGIGSPEGFFRDVCVARSAYKLKTLESGRKDLKDGAEQVLEELEARGFRLGVVSNSPEKSLEEVLRFFDLEFLVEFYRGVQDRQDLRHRKPDTFLLEIAEAEIDGRSVFIGDSRVDRVSAEKEAMESILIGEDVSSLGEVPGEVSKLF